MQAAANSNLILTDLSSFKRLAGLQKAISHAGFYQQVLSELIRGVYRKRTFTELGNSLVALVRHAYALRQMRAVEETSQLLLNLPFGKEYENVGRYYQALCIYQRGRIAEAHVLLEKVAGKLPPLFKARALLPISIASYYQSGDLKSCLLLNVEASRAAAYQGSYDPQTFFTSQRNIAVLKSIDGDHRGALSDLEKLFPLARVVGRWQPYLYYEHLNSLSVELMENGRLDEAKNASRIALASPFAHAYPEWRETREEIELRGWRRPRATVAFGRRTPEVENLVRLPVTDRQGSAGREEHIPRHTTQRARVLDLLEWKKKMGKEPNDTPRDKKNYKEMDGRQRLLKIIELAGSTDRTDDELERILDAIDRILSEPKDKGKQ